MILCAYLGIRHIMVAWGGRRYETTQPLWIRSAVMLNILWRGLAGLLFIPHEAGGRRIGRCSGAVRPL